MRRHRPGRGRGPLPGRSGHPRQQGDAAPAQRGHAGARHHRCHTAPAAAGPRGALRPEPAGPLLQQQPGAVPVGHAQLRHGGGPVGLHPQPEVCRCPGADRRTGDADLAVPAGALRQGQRPGALRQARRDAGGVPEHLQARPHRRRGGQRAGHRRHLPRAQGGGPRQEPGRQDGDHLCGGRRAAGLLQALPRQPGGRCLAPAVRPGGGHQRDRGDDPGRAGQAGGGCLGRRLPRDHRRAAASAAPAAPHRGVPQHPALCLCHPSAQPGVHPQGLPHPQGHAQVRDGPGGDARGTHAADGVLQDGEHRLPHRCAGRGLADLGGRHPQGDAGPQPGVHLPPPAGRSRDGREAGCADHGPGRLHQGGGRCRGDGGAACAHPHHHRQQLLGLRCPLGRCRCHEAHGPGQAGPEDQAGDGAHHGDRRHRLHRLGQRAAAGHGLQAGGDCRA